MMNPRRCVFCRKVKPLDELLRVARLGDKVIYDKDKKAQGRGAYVCRDLACIEGAIKHRGLDRSLKCRVSEEVYKSFSEAYDG